MYILKSCRLLIFGPNCQSRQMNTKFTPRSYDLHVKISFDAQCWIGSPSAMTSKADALRQHRILHSFPGYLQIEFYQTNPCPLGRLLGILEDFFFLRFPWCILLTSKEDDFDCKIFALGLYRN